MARRERVAEFVQRDRHRERQRAREAEREGSEVHHEQHEQDNERHVEIHRYPECVADSELARKHVGYSTIFCPACATPRRKYDILCAKEN